MFNLFRIKNICFKFRGVLTKQMRVKVNGEEKKINTLTANTPALEVFRRLSKKNKMFIIIDSNSEEQQDVENFIRKNDLNVFNILYWSDDNPILSFLKQYKIDRYIKNTKDLE